MIMAGIEFKGDVPFRNVYFTSIIRDDKGRKLSKSLGNSPDPLEVIKSYGADALRFSIAYIAPVGMDIRYSNDKCEIGRNFANKLWNACRFRQMQGETTNSFLDLAGVNASDLTPDERWIIAWLNDTINTVNASLEKFSFHQAAHQLYEFVWSVFCDWFIEASKSRFAAGGAAKAQALAEARALAESLSATPPELTRAGLTINQDGQRRSAMTLLAYPDIDLARLAALWPALGRLDVAIGAQLEIDGRYAGYLERQAADIRALRKDEALGLPASVDYDAIGGLSTELRDKLKRIRPESLAAAGRIPGMTPAALTALLGHVKRIKLAKSA